jgi:hypothetical protein
MVRLAPITQGFDFNFFQKITVTWNTFGGGAPDGYSSDLVILFPTQGVLLLNEDGYNSVQVSFNGQTVHDQLDPSLPSRGVAYDNRVISGIWFRLVSGNSAIISIRAWSVR